MKSSIFFVPMQPSAPDLCLRWAPPHGGGECARIHLCYIQMKYSLKFDFFLSNISTCNGYGMGEERPPLRPPTGWVGGWGTWSPGSAKMNPPPVGKHFLKVAIVAALSVCFSINPVRSHLTPRW